MSLITQLLLGGGIHDQYLWTAIIITAFFTIYMLFVARLLEGIPYVQKIDTLLFLMVIISWLAFFSKNFVTTILSSVWYSLATAILVIFVTIIVVRGRGAK